MARKPRIVVKGRRLLTKLSYLVRLLGYDIFIGSRSGLVALSHGISFGPDVGVELGAKVYLGRNGIFQGAGTVVVGAGTYVGNFFDFNARSTITIGENCMLANFVTIVDNNHGTANGTDMKYQPIVSESVAIGRNCWLGEKCTILAGVRIGEGAVVAAGAVVTSDVPPNAIVGGIPARILRYRDAGLLSDNSAQLLYARKNGAN
jgi:acetyltransferase-like isoleucine patch superfamily enzyme